MITDYFTKLAHFFQCQDQAKSVAKKVWEGFFCVYSFPQCIYSDQGANFESELLAKLLALSGVSESHTSLYCPMGNGIGFIAPPRSKQKWPQMVQSLRFVCNRSIHETTIFAPFYLKFVRVPRVPIDLMLQSVLRDDSVGDYDSYVKSLVDDLCPPMLQAQRSSTRQEKLQSDQFNKSAKALPLAVDDQVLLANRGARVKRSLSDRWKPLVYTVVASKPALYIY